MLLEIQEVRWTSTMEYTRLPIPDSIDLIDESLIGVSIECLSLNFFHLMRPLDLNESSLQKRVHPNLPVSLLDRLKRCRNVRHQRCSVKGVLLDSFQR